MKSVSLLLLFIVLSFCSAFAQFIPYEARRAVIFAEIGEDIALIKNSGSDYVLKMEVNWNYYFLTGDQSDGAFLVLNGKNKTATIYKEALQYSRQQAEAKEINGVNIKTMDEFQRDLGSSFSRMKTLWIDFSSMPDLNSSGLKLGNLESIKNLAPFIHRIRKYKDEYEMKMLEHAIQTTAEGLVEVMKSAKPGMNEKDFELILDYKFAKAGCENLGFGIQAASGPNATHVHYGNNDRDTEKGDMMVFDVGARSGFYSADISRSFPVSGKFTKEQKEIYGLVLKAQKTAISNMTPGNTIGFASNSALDVLNEGLAELGLITDLESSWQKRIWIQHGFFHHIGLVVHDVGGYSGILEPGMILTMEPGLYFPADYLDQITKRQERNVDVKELEAFIKAVKPTFEKYINIGVRIEDDVYITKDGNKVISSGVPKEIDDIEDLMKESSIFQ